MRPIAWNIQNSDTGYFGNSFFEQLQPFVSQLNEKVRHAGDIAAGTGEAFNYASLDRIGPLTCHNGWSRVARIFGRGSRHPRRLRQ